MVIDRLYNKLNDQINCKLSLDFNYFLIDFLELRRTINDWFYL